MTKYTYQNHILRVKSDFLITYLDEVTITKRDTEKIVSTTYEVGRLIKREESGGYYYAWFDAKPLTVSVDNSPELNRKVEEEVGGIWDAVARGIGLYEGDMGDG